MLALLRPLLLLALPSWRFTLALRLVGCLIFQRRKRSSEWHGRGFLKLTKRKTHADHVGDNFLRGAVGRLFLPMALRTPGARRGHLPFSPLM